MAAAWGNPFPVMAVLNCTPSIRRRGEKPMRLKKFGGSKLRDRRSATRQSGSESCTSDESAGKFRGTVAAKAIG